MLCRHIILAVLTAFISQQSIAFALPQDHSSYITLSARLNSNGVHDATAIRDREMHADKEFPLHARLANGAQQTAPASKSPESEIAPLIGTDPKKPGFISSGYVMYFKTPGVPGVPGEIPATQAQVKKVAKTIWSKKWKGRAPKGSQIKSRADVEKVLLGKLMTKPPKIKCNFIYAQDGVC
ncbi:hypothetical protein B0O99DRAFT_742980 [Bisporella sp. PMI_857]|nr:hypothetical protein B0O99DRAFT_742980 [Bisporella sp. PMI_857]